MMATLGHILKLFRMTAKDGLTTHELGKAIGTSGAFVSEFERDKKNLSLETLKKLSKYFNVPQSEFFRIQEKSEAENLSREETFLEVVKTFKKYNEHLFA